ncbi:MAG TPA: vWA domain-containing protein [Pirellulales bacterium]|nr:vWA domain-containing protein [Pirellulales bacterium]
MAEIRAMRALWLRLSQYLAEPWLDEDDLLAAAYQTSSRAAFVGPGSGFNGRTGCLRRRAVLRGAILSAVAHAAVLVTLAQFAVVEPPKPTAALVTVIPQFDETPLETDEADFLPAEEIEEQAENALASAVMSAASVVEDDPLLTSVSEPTEVAAPIELPPLLADVSGFQLSDTVVQTGSVGVEVKEVEGAVDRLTEEILTNLEQSRVLVVWLMDASISLVPDRSAVADRLEQIYRELDSSGGASTGALTSAVVAFGQQVQEITPPTTDYGQVVDSIRKVPTDASGIENVFSAVLGCVIRYQKQRLSEHRRVMIVIWTDESGNDYARLEEAVQFCRNNVIPVYIVGPSAMFGKEQGTLSYRHTDGKTYQLPVDRGPDSVREERLHVPYWFDGSQYETLHAGLGPFALTRLAHESGGAYFIKDNPGDRSPFAIETMRRYEPEYNSPDEYLREASHSSLRKAVLTVVDMTRQRKLKGTPRLTFSPTGQTFFNEMREAQETAAYNSAILQQCLAVFGGRGLEQAYAKETSPRWRAWYDLTYGRLMAMMVRCNEYNWACATMKAKGADFVDKKSNRWQFKPDKALHYGSQDERMTKEATRLLTRCVQENPGTPWALLAQRELKDPFGFRVDEAYVPPPPPPPKPKPGKPTPPPPPPPQPNGRRMEQPRKLEKPVEAQLPKL